MLALSACGGPVTHQYDEELLDEYRAVIPEADEVTAVTPGPEGSPNAVTLRGDAELANLAADSARDINAPAKLAVLVLRAITDTEPTFYDSESEEFLWGPWDNEDGYGQVMAYIRKNPKGDDFEYGYALLRLVNSDTATATPVVWGGASPDAANEDLGVGVTLWDFDANNAFDKKYDDDHQTQGRTQGRFVMAYGAEPAEHGNGIFGFNVAVFRDFVPEDAEPDAEPADLDYFYGRVTGDDGNRIDFLDWVLTGNLCNADADSCFGEEVAPGQDESLSLRAAFVNKGFGRAEATISGGDLGDRANVVECWDDDINRTALQVSVADLQLAELGDCQAPFEQSLIDLGIPTLADIDQEILETMDCVATNGLEACDQDSSVEMK